MGTLEVFIVPQHQIKREKYIPYNYEIATYSAAIKSIRCHEKPEIFYFPIYRRGERHKMPL